MPSFKYTPNCQSVVLLYCCKWNRMSLFTQPLYMYMLLIFQRREYFPKKEKKKKKKRVLKWMERLGKKCSYQESGKTLGQKRRASKGAGGHVWDLWSLLGILLVRDNGCHQSWYLNHSLDSKLQRDYLISNCCFLLSARCTHFLAWSRALQWFASLNLCEMLKTLVKTRPLLVLL